LPETGGPVNALIVRPEISEAFSFRLPLSHGDDRAALITLLIRLPDTARAEMEMP
jgi:hypothetical protein